MQRTCSKNYSTSGTADSVTSPLTPVNILSLLTLGIVASGLLTLTGCGTTQANRATPSSTVGADIPSRVTPFQAEEVTIYAIGLVGTPYRYGGNTPQSGFDCSGLIGHVYLTRAKVSAPRTVAKLSGWGSAISADQLRSGDLVLFSQRDVATHAGIYVGEGRFVHAPSTGGEVRLDSLGSKYWAAQQITFRRP